MNRKINESKKKFNDTINTLNNSFDLRDFNFGSGNSNQQHQEQAQ